MTGYKKALGARGEEIACNHLESQGYRVTGRNVRGGHDEIDIIAENGDLLLFVEVKTRRQAPDVKNIYGRPASAVDREKRQNLMSAVRRYLHENRKETEAFQPRIDIIEVYVDPSEKAYKVLDIRHFPNAVHG